MYTSYGQICRRPRPLPLPRKKKKVSSQSHRLPHRTLKRQNSNFLPIPHFFLCKNILLQNIFDFFGRVGPREQDGAGHVERFLDATCTTAAGDGFAEIGTAPEEEVRGVVGEFGEMAAGGFDEREILSFWSRFDGDGCGVVVVVVVVRGVFGGVV